MLIIVLATAILIVVAANAWQDRWERKEYRLRHDRLKRFSGEDQWDADRRCEDGDDNVP